MQKEDLIESFWKRFLTDANLPEDTEYLEAFHFDLHEAYANELLAMVLSGKKTATSSSGSRYKITGEIPPYVGAYSIVTDFIGKPICIIETINIEVIPFVDMTYDVCRREGEDDTLESWIATHTRFFTEESQQLGYAFTPQMPVLFEDFKVVYRRD